MRSHSALTVGLTAAILGFFASTAGFASELGLASPRDWQGNGARVQQWALDYSTRFEAATDLKTLQDATSQAHYLWDDGGLYVEGLGQSKYKELKGFVSASGYTDLWQAGGYYRDEIYFSTANGQPGDLAITFNISATGNTNAPDNATAFLSIGWSYYGSLIFPAQLGTATLIDLKGANQSGEFNGTVTMHSGESPYAGDGGYLITSGTYVPFSLGVWGTVTEGSLDWSHTVGFLSFSVFQNGIQLAPGEFTILEGVGIPAVPEPETWALLLAGLGLLGFAARRRKQIKAA